LIGLSLRTVTLMAALRAPIGVALLVAAIAATGAVDAQTYGAGVSSSGQANCNNSGSSQNSANGGSSGLYGDSSSNGQQGSCGSNYQQGGGATQSVSPSIFSPVVIQQTPSQSDTPAQPVEDLRVTAPADNSTSTPLYARPTGSGGAFQL
jgi:hypothetical protein